MLYEQSKVKDYQFIFNPYTVTEGKHTLYPSGYAQFNIIIDCSTCANKISCNFPNSRCNGCRQGNPEAPIYKHWIWDQRG